MPNAVEVVIKALDSTKGGLQSALRSLDGFKSSALAMSGAVAAVAAVAGVALFDMTKRFAESADEIGKLSQKTGIATEDLTALRFVAEDNNVTWEQFQKALRKAAEEATKTDGSFKNLLLDNADRFASFADGAGKAAEAQRIFGKAGADIIPILNLGKKGLQDAIQESKEFTTVITAQTAATGDAFGDNLDRIGRTIQKVFTDGIKEALPFLLSMTASMLDMTKTFFGTGSALDTYLVPGMRLFGKGMALTAAAAVNLKDQVQGLAETMFGFFLGGKEAAGSSWDELLKKMMENGQKLKAIWDDKPPTPELPKPDSTHQLYSPEELKKAAQLQREIITEGLTGSAQLQAKLDDTYAKRKEQIADLKVDEDEKSSLEVLALESRTEQEMRLRLTAHNFKADLSALEATADLEGVQKLLDTGAAANAIRLEQNQAFVSLYVDQWRQAHASITSFATTMFGSFSQNFGTAIGEILRDFGHAGDAAKKFGQAMLTSITNFVGQWIASQITMAAMSAIFGTATAATVAAAAAPVALAWAGPAALVSLATFGSNSAPAIAGMIAAAVAAKGIAAFGSIGGAAHGGLDYVPQESTYLLQKGEAVLQPAANVALMDFLGNQQHSGPSMVEVHIDGEVLGRGIGRISRDGRLVISSKSIT